MNKRWTMREMPDQAIVNNLSGILNIDPVLAALLVNRGITTFDEARRFFT